MDETKKWLSKVAVVPRKTLPLSKDVDSSPLHVVNNNPDRLAFKLKTTRSASLKPNVTCGFLEPNGGCVHIRVAYKPGEDEKGLHDNDRLTVIMKPVTDGSKNWEACLIETKESPCGRIVLQLKQTPPEMIGTVLDEDESTTTSSEP